MESRKETLKIKIQKGRHTRKRDNGQKQEKGSGKGAGDRRPKDKLAAVAEIENGKEGAEKEEPEIKAADHAEEIAKEREALLEKDEHRKHGVKLAVKTGAYLKALQAHKAPDENKRVRDAV